MGACLFQVVRFGGDRCGFGSMFYIGGCLVVWRDIVLFRLACVILRGRVVCSDFGSFRGRLG
jgi:hypothetical protein